MELLWLGIGIGSTIAVMLPVMVVLLRRVVHRAREAEGESEALPATRRARFDDRWSCA